MIIMPPPQTRQRKPERAQVQEAAANAGLVLPDVAVLALQQGRVIEAIKLIRHANPGLDLARAKAVMQRIQAQAQARATVARAGTDPMLANRPAKLLQQDRPPTVAMGDPPGQLRWLLAVVVLLVGALWLAFDGVL